MSLRIYQVAAESIAEELGLMPGDCIRHIDGCPVVDFLDLHLAIARGVGELLVQTQAGEETLYELDLDPGDDLGIDVEPPVPLECGNRCVFCFVHQLPRGLRRSLYIKDEDYRYSYLYGSYITLTNITDAQVDRILRENLSPLYISVHATDNSVRSRLLGVEAPPILPLLQRLIDGGIELHTQVVLCPGWNDGEVLDQTIADLAALAPGIVSLALVAVGLTAHRRGLPPLEPVSREQARLLLHQVEGWQQRLLTQLGTRFVWPVDEFYLKAELPFPDARSYEDYPQLDNGVGLVPLFREETQEMLAEAESLRPARLTLVTGSSAAAEVQELASLLGKSTGVRLQVEVIANTLFGEQVTVAGLMAGRDILRQLQGKSLGEAVLIPDVCLRSGEGVFLDDLRPEDLANQLGCPVIAVESSPWGLYNALDEFLSDVEIVRSGKGDT